MKKEKLKGDVGKMPKCIRCGKTEKYLEGWKMVENPMSGDLLYAGRDPFDDSYKLFWGLCEKCQIKEQTETCDSKIIENEIKRHNIDIIIKQLEYKNGSFSGVFIFDEPFYLKYGEKLEIKLTYESV